MRGVASMTLSSPAYASNMSPKFTGVWVPKEVLEHEGLTVTEKVAYGIIDSLDGEDGCYASNGYLGRILGVSPRQVKNIVNALLEAGLVTRQVEANAQGSVRYLHTVAKKALVDVTSFPRGVKQVAPTGGNPVHPDSKENKKEDKPTLTLPYGEAFQLAWDKWVAYRIEIKKSMKPTTMREQLSMLAGWGSETKAVNSINKSIAMGWQGLFADNAQKTKPTLTNNDHAKGF
jgi:DNA-binding MarR family transcriptional regulator